MLSYCVQVFLHQNPEEMSNSEISVTVMSHKMTKWSILEFCGGACVPMAPPPLDPPLPRMFQVSHGRGWSVMIFWRIPIKKFSSPFTIEYSWLYLCFSNNTNGMFFLVHIKVLSIASLFKMKVFTLKNITFSCFYAKYIFTQRYYLFLFLVCVTMSQGYSVP